MAVYYKFKSAKDYDSIAIDGPSVSVGALKHKIFVLKHLGRGTDFDLTLTSAQTNQELLDEEMLIPKNTSVIIRRVPGWPSMPIVIEKPKLEVAVTMEDVQPEMNSSVLAAADSSDTKYTEVSEWDDFGNDLYGIPEVFPVQSSYPVAEATPTDRADEDSKIKALMDTPAIDWQRQGADGFGPGRGFGRSMSGRITGGRGFGRAGFEPKIPPQGYICHRCKVPGHFIQHCPTNGDPNFDIKRVKPPTGIPKSKSMLMATPDGSYGLPSGAVAVLNPNVAAFEKEIEGIPPSTRSVDNLPQELHCPLCKEVMKDAVITSKCCFKSFCDKCVRDYIISKFMCVCGAKNILTDDLLPNMTLRATICRFLESANSSTKNAGSTFQVHDMESAHCQQPKVPSPALYAVSNGDQKQSPHNEGSPRIKETADEGKAVIAQQQMSEKARNAKVAGASEATLKSKRLKEPAPQGSVLLAEEEVQQNLASGEAGMKKKRKKVHLPANSADLLQRTSQDLAAESYMMAWGPSAYNPYWTSMQHGMEGYAAPYACAMPALQQTARRFTLTQF